jgi:methionyl-tRNA formyltransferase
MRVVLIASAPPPALGLSATLARMGHDVAALVAFRGPHGRYGYDYPFGLHRAAPDGDLLFVRSGVRLGQLLRAYEPDIGICASFPSLIPDDALAVPRHGILNIHPGRLPRYRGPNPLGWSIRNGDAELGLTVHRMTSEFDAGPIYAQAAIPISDHEDPALDGVQRFDELAGRLLAEALARVKAGEPGDLQDESLAGYAGIFEPAYVEVDWSNDARYIHNQTRAWKMSPPVDGRRGPLAELDGGRVRLLRTSLDGARGGTRIDCGDGPLWVLDSEPVAAAVA